VSGFPEAKSGLFMNKHRKTSCLSPQEIASWLAGQLSEDACRAIEAHLEGCLLCQEEVADRQDIANFAELAHRSPRRLCPLSCQSSTTPSIQAPSARLIEPGPPPEPRTVDPDSP